MILNTLDPVVRLEEHEQNHEVGISSASSSSQKKKTDMEDENTQGLESDFESGPPIDGKLVDWLDARAGKRLIHLPVDIDADALGIESASLKSGDWEIVIELDTGALSIDLPMHLAGLTDRFPCRVWLEGTWGPLFPEVVPGPAPVFSVRRVIEIANKSEARIRFSK